MLLDNGQVACELREDERLVSFGQQILQVEAQHVELGARFFVAIFIQQTGMAGGLPQAQQGFEDVHLGLREPLFLDDSKDRCAVVVAHFVVECFLILPHRAEDRLLEFVGEFLGNFFLRSSQDERPKRLRQ